MDKLKEKVKFLKEILDYSMENHMSVTKASRYFGKGKNFFQQSLDSLRGIEDPLVYELIAQFEVAATAIRRKAKIEPTYGEFDVEGMHIVLPCVHVPFHDKELFDNMLRLVIDHKDKIAGFHIIGDFADLNSLSAYDKGKVPMPGITLSKEYEECNKVLDQIDRILPKKCIKTYIYGNHEDRYFRYMSDIDNSKLGDILASPKDALNLKDRGYGVYENWRESYVTLGKHLDLIHGEYLVQNCAKKHVDVYKRSMMFGHSHRMGSYIDGDMAGYNIGCMIDMESPAFNYASRATKSVWRNGFAVVNIDKEGNFYVEQVIQHNNKFFYGGKEYK